ncbi:MAG: phosphoglucosamine mutase [Thermoleophilia bacterium]|nr:phosphoglucosamine mutase [Thermoleophilia bacterium]
MTRRYFGTDGIRGVANQLLTADLALAAGRAAVAALNQKQPRILIGRDTRISGPMLEAALVAGICSAGGQAVLAEVIPTPAVASLVVSESLDAGVVISASHNPYRDNGVKFFGPSGFKLTDAQETEMESFLSRAGSFTPAPEPGPVRRIAGPGERYVDNVLSHFDIDLSGLKLILDCAHGATWETAPMALRRLGAEVTVVCARPDGFNINEGCGSTNIHTLQEKVRNDGFDAGFAFDGDGDRVIAVDSRGEVVDGDFIMAICAKHLKQKGKLKKDTVVTTVMTNLGFHLAMKELGIRLLTTAVGDRYVLEEMLAGGYNLGGEQSGHIIYLKTGTTGDGLATALLLLEVMTDSGQPLDELARIMTRFPQKLVNVQVENMEELRHAREIWDQVDEETARLGNEGRVLVRASGTEPVVRVMVEAETAGICDDVSSRIVAVVEKTLGTV